MWVIRLENLMSLNIWAGLLLSPREKRKSFAKNIIGIVYVALVGILKYTHNNN
jgi:hypothetical protein